MQRAIECSSPQIVRNKSEGIGYWEILNTEFSQLRKWVTEIEVMLLLKIIRGSNLLLRILIANNLKTTTIPKNM